MQNKISGVLLVFRNPAKTPLFFFTKLEACYEKEKKIQNEN